MRRIRRALLVLFLVLGLTPACCLRVPDAPNITVVGEHRNRIEATVYISPEFSVEERDDIISGISMWQVRFSDRLAFKTSRKVPGVLEEPRQDSGVTRFSIVFKKISDGTVA